MYADRHDDDPDPIGRGWEAGAAAVLIATVGFALAALVGQGLAALLFGGGWVWPRGAHNNLVRAIGGLIAGHPGAGLNRADIARLPDTTAVYASVAFVEIVAVTLVAVSCIAWARYRRPHDARRGMATRAEASRILGVAELRRAQPIVRPDLRRQP